MGEEEGGEKLWGGQGERAVGVKEKEGRRTALVPFPGSIQHLLLTYKCTNNQ